MPMPLHPALRYTAIESTAACGGRAVSNSKLGYFRVIHFGAFASTLGLGVLCGTYDAVADEGGVGFWVPGIFGSLAATPQQLGLSFASIYYHTSVSAGGDVAAARQVSLGNITTNLTTNLNLHLNADADLGFFSSSYVFATPILGGQASVSLLAPVGRSSGSVDGTLTGALGPLGFTISGSRADSVTGFGDVAPQFALRWNQGVNNYMTYVTADVPVGAYDSKRLANLGLGHSAIDAGGGYTYFNPQTGHEFSATAGLTYNFLNTSTQYQNGVDAHLDWGASQFFTKQLQIGAVGYFYNQLSCDSGSGDRVGCFQSRVIGIGRRSATLFRSAASIRDTSTSRATRSSTRCIVRTAGTSG
jgi:hypothetical protein